MRPGRATILVHSPPPTISSVYESEKQHSTAVFSLKGFVAPFSWIGHPPSQTANFCVTTVGSICAPAEPQNQKLLIPTNVLYSIDCDLQQPLNNHCSLFHSLILIRVIRWLKTGHTIVGQEFTSAYAIQASMIRKGCRKFFQFRPNVEK